MHPAAHAPALPLKQSTEGGGVSGRARQVSEQVAGHARLGSERDFRRLCPSCELDWCAAPSQWHRSDPASHGGPRDTRSDDHSPLFASPWRLRVMPACSSFGAGVYRFQALPWLVEAAPPQPGRVPVLPVASWASQDTVLDRARFRDLPVASIFDPGSELPRCCV